MLLDDSHPSIGRVDSRALYQAQRLASRRTVLLNTLLGFISVSGKILYKAGRECKTTNAATSIKKDFSNKVG